MAQEEIKLVGSFKDDITPKLQKLNKEIANIGRSFERFNKKLSPVTKNFAKMAMSAKEFSTAMQGQRKALDSSSRSMMNYRKEAGKMAGAMKKVTEARIRSQRQMGMSRAEARKSGGMGMPGMGGGGGKGAGAAAGASAAKGFNGGIKSVAIGSAIGNIAAQGIMKGVQGLKNLAMAPFKKFGAMFGERVRDEMDDIKSAGGLFALDMDLTQESGNERFFKNYNGALRFQEKLNISMAESAAALPGVTSQYVDTSRQLTDTIQMVMEKDREGFNKMAEGFGADISMGGVDASKNAMQKVLQKQTEQVVLQSQGQKGGLPMHIAIQQLMGKEAKDGKIGMQAFTNKFRAAFQKNPLLKNFLLRAEKDLAGTAAGSADRLKILMETFDKAMPKEVINKMRGSISGMQEALRSGLLDPQAGLFGMSRANFVDGQALMKDNVDDFGNKLFKITGDVFTDNADLLEKLGVKAGDSLKGAEVTEKQLGILKLKLDETGRTLLDGNKEVGKVSQSSTYIFEQIREILAGYGPVLLEFVGFLPKLFDPFGKMTQGLMGFRDKAQEFIAGFNEKIDAMDQRSLFLTSQKDSKQQGLGNTLKGQTRSRAAVSTVAEYLKGLGAINEDLFNQIQKASGDTSAKGIKAFEKGIITQFIGPLLKQLMESPLMGDFGQIGGQIVGGIINMILEMVNMFTGVVQGQGTNVFLDGFKKGFQDAFGGKSLGDIKGIVVDAMSAVFTKVADLVITRIIPILITLLTWHISSLFQSLLTGGIGAKVLALMGIIKTVTITFSIISGIASTLGTALAFVTGTISAITGAIAFVMPVLVSLGGILGTVLVALGPILLILLGVAALLLVLKEAEAVITGFGLMLRVVGEAGVWVIAGIKAAVFGLLDMIPGQNFKKQQQAAQQEQLNAQRNMVILNGKLAKNTEESIARTKDMFGMGDGTSTQPKAEEETLPAPKKHKGGRRAGGGNKKKTPELPPADVQANIDKVNEQTVALENSTPSIEAQTVAVDKANTSIDDLSTKATEAGDNIKASLEGAATAAGNAITLAAKNLAQALNSAASSLKTAGKASGGDTTKTDGAAGAYDGHEGGRGAKTLPLAQAIAKERSMMPSGSDLMIANTSETVIPAFAGHAGDGFKGLSFAELESAAGFDRMKSYTDQVKEIADKTAASFGGFGGALGGGSATLNAMEALGNSHGLTTTSGFRPGDPGFHGANRARDLSDGSGETPGMNKVASIMANQFGSSLTELIYTPMGFSIKNGQKTGLISPDNHYHHIHVAVAEGLQKAAVFSSEQAALNYEKSMMPGGASPMKVDLSSMTANSSEFSGGGGLTVGDVHVNVSGVDNPREIATVVADEILAAVQRATYTELHTS